MTSQKEFEWNLSGPSARLGNRIEARTSETVGQGDSNSKDMDSDYIS